MAFLFYRNIHYPPETCSIMLIARMIATVRQVCYYLLDWILKINIDHQCYKTLHFRCNKIVIHKCWSDLIICDVLNLYTCHFCIYLKGAVYYSSIILFYCLANASSVSQKIVPTQKVSSVSSAKQPKMKKKALHINYLENNFR